VVVELSIFVGCRLMSPDSQAASAAVAAIQSQARLIIIGFSTGRRFFVGAPLASPVCKWGN
jgi:hypothetical protein